ncbi:unnamed protein product [marine sediment metagenome]|uniref:PhoU domain-containing protein n=1 Tax=marine sediment metagenome TaxID=412755 RepID=X0T5W7_9ZZZZ
MLEKIGDYCEELAKQVISILNQSTEIEAGLLKDIEAFGNFMQTTYDKTVKAFFSLNLKQANEAIELVESANLEERPIQERIVFEAERMIREERDPSLKKAGTASGGAKDFLNLAMSLRILVWNLGQILNSCSTINEISINRRLEEVSDICTIEKDLRLENQI